MEWQLCIPYMRWRNLVWYLFEIVPFSSEIHYIPSELLSLSVTSFLITKSKAYKIRTLLLCAFRFKMPSINRSIL